MNKFKFDKKSKRVFELSQKLNDGLINDCEGAELNSLIKDEPDLQLLYLSLREQELEMTERFSGSSIHDRPLSGELTSSEAVTKKPLKMSIPICVMALILLSFFLGQSLQKTSEINNVPQAQTKELSEDIFQETLANVKISLDVDNLNLSEGSSLTAGPFSFKSGQICLDMSSGMQITIQGPAKINLIDANSIEVTEGQVRLQSLLKRPDFSVLTKYGKITDQVADFGIDLNSSTTSISCFEGSILFTKNNLSKELTTGQSLSLKEQRPVEAPRYLSFQQLQDLAKKQNIEKLSSWLEYRDQLKKDPDTAFFYDFVPNIYAIDNLNQRAYRGEVAPAHGKIIGAHWADGRFPKTQSLHFQNSNDRVKFNLDEEFNQMTINLWLKLDRNTGNNIHGILLSERYEQHQIFLQLITRDENWHFKFSAKQHFVCTSKLFSENELLGKWSLLSLTMDNKQKQVAIYLNGTDITKILQMTNTGPVYPGWVDLMNWLPIREHDIRNTPGQVDFLSIHRKAFTPEEIKDFYENSKHD